MKTVSHIYFVLLYGLPYGFLTSVEFYVLSSNIFFMIEYNDNFSEIN